MDIEPIKNAKREVSSLVPYRRAGDVLEFYLQMRDEHAKTNAGRFGMFGGGIDAAETPFEAMVREMSEELEYDARNAQYFCRYEWASTIAHLFIEEVAADFQTKVVVREGQYGKFLQIEEIDTSPLVTPPVRMVARQISDYLLQGK